MLQGKEYPADSVCRAGRKDVWGSAAAPRHHKPTAAQLPLLPHTTLETTHQNLGIYFLVIPFPSLLCQGCVCSVWDGAINLILAEGSIRDEPFPCSIPKFSPASDGSPRPELHCSPELRLYPQPPHPLGAMESTPGVWVQPRESRRATQAKQADVP